MGGLPALAAIPIRNKGRQAAHGTLVPHSPYAVSAVSSCSVM